MLRILDNYLANEIKTTSNIDFYFLNEYDQYGYECTFLCEDIAY